METISAPAGCEPEASRLMPLVDSLRHPPEVPFVTLIKSADPEMVVLETGIELNRCAAMPAGRVFQANSVNV